MIRQRSLPILALALLTALVSGGCNPQAGAPKTAESAAGWEPREAQPRLRTIPLRVGPHAVEAEVALGPREQATGLMFRESLEPEQGMLFVFPFERPVAFFMKNTRVPLTVAYLGPDGVIRELHDLEPLVERPVNSASDEIRFVLEMNRGWFAAKGVGPGVRITTAGQSLGEVFPGADAD